uniref:Zinc finger protein 771-like n=2 Tax=Salarias fasciatus TaxID=181472 RepID=A0A672IL71_SALFA
FIKQRLTAAAGEIFTVFQQIIVQFEEEIYRQSKLLETCSKPPVHFHPAESPQQQEHEAPHSREDEGLVGNDHFLDSERDSTTQRLTAAAVEICTLFEQTIVQYQEKIERQNRLLEVCLKPQIKLPRAELQQHRDWREEQLFQQEPSCSLEQGEPEPEPPHNKEVQVPEPPQIKEEPEEPEAPQINNEQQEPEPPQIKEEHEESVCNKRELCPEAGTVSGGRTGEACGRQVSHSLDQMSTQSGEKPYACEICGRRFILWPFLRNHIRTHTVVRSYSCATCNESFSRHNALLVHMRTHTGEEPFSFETYCENFSQHNNSSVQIITHADKELYSCERCGRSFSHPCYLRSHMRTHIGKSLYSCGTCNESFKRPNALFVHMRTHSGEKPYSCETCGRRFTQQSQLLVHMRTHSGEEPYSQETWEESQ